MPDVDGLRDNTLDGRRGSSRLGRWPSREGGRHRPAQPPQRRGPARQRAIVVFGPPEPVVPADARRQQPDRHQLQRAQNGPDEAPSPGKEHGPGQSPGAAGDRDPSAIEAAAQVRLELGHGSRQQAGGNVEQRLHHRGLGAVAVPLLRRERLDQPLVDEQDRLHQRRVDPPEQLRIVRGIPLAGGEPRDAIVDRVDPGGGRDRLLVIAERQRHHRADGRAQARDPRGGTASKAAVLVDGRGNERVRELEEDGPSPAHDHHDLAVDGPADAAGPGPAHARRAKALPDPSAVPFEGRGIGRIHRAWPPKYLIIQSTLHLISGQTVGNDP